MNIEDICIHEAAHAVVYEALDIPLQQVWIEEDKQGMSWGMAERGKSPADLAPSLIVLEFMAGAAALLHLTTLPADRVIKKTASDFSTALIYLTRSSEADPRRLVQWLEMAARGFVAEWTKTHHEVIIGLASALQRRRVPHGRCELDGTYIRKALAANWNGRPSRADVIAFAEASWTAVQTTGQPPTESGWQEQVLESWTEMENK
jgi:hypothetical protein